MEFSEFGLSEPVAEVLRKKGFTTPTPIQAQAIPPLMQGRDLLGRAATGSGKTLAFGLPLVERVESARVSIQALVVCPTRELAQQVAEDLSEIGEAKGTKVALVVGGVHVRTQRMKIPGKQIVVGTPGRIIDLLEDRFLPVEWVEYFVLDEFDRLLDMGFLDDIKRIVKRLPRERQTALFSATVPPMIIREAQKLLNNPVQIEIGSARRAVETIDQRAIRTKSARKLPILEKLLDAELDADGTVVVFCNTKRAVRQVDRELWAKNYSVAALSGDHDQSVRFKVMERFRNQEIRVLVATDVAARGLDIDHIGHVINFDAPFETEDYVHRIGRTARAGRDGVVTTLVGDEDAQAFDRIKRSIDQKIEMIPEPGRGRPSRKKARPEKTEDSAPPRSAAGSGAKPKPEVEADTFGEIVNDPKGETQPVPPRDEARPEAEVEAKLEVETETKTPVTEERPAEDGEPRRRRRRRGGRGRKRRSNEDETASDETESRVAERDDDGRTAETDEDREEKPRRRRRSRRDEDDESGEGSERSARDDEPERGDERSESRDDEDGDDRPRRRRRSRGGRGRGRKKTEGEKGEKPERPAKSDDEKKERSSSSRDRDGESSRGRRRRSRDSGSEERGGRRRNRNDYKRWEEEQLNRPVGLIEDSPSANEEPFAREDKGRGEDNDNAPAPFIESPDGPSEADTDRRGGRRERGGRGERGERGDRGGRGERGGRGGRGRRGGRGSDRGQGGGEDRAAEKPAPKPKERQQGKDENDIVW